MIEQGAAVVTVDDIAARAEISKGTVYLYFESRETILAHVLLDGLGILLEKLDLAGMNVARLNFSHGTHDSHAARFETLRSVAKRLDRPLGILQDLQGPKIRVGVLTNPLDLKVGQGVALYPETSSPLAPNSIPVDFPELFGAVHPGDRILLDDGKLALRVKSTSSESVAGPRELLRTTSYPFATASREI